MNEFIGERARAAEAAPSSRPALDVRADFPVLESGHRLPRLGRHVAEAGGGHRGDGRLLPRLVRPDPPQRLPAGRRVDRAVRGRARAGRRVRGLGAGHHDLHRQRHRGDQPGGLLVGPRATSARATRCSSPTWSTTPTSCRGRCCAPSGARALRYLRVSDEGELDLAELDEVLAGGRVKLVGVAHISNVLGTINPVAEIAARARAAGRRLAGGRLAGRAPDAGRPAGARRRLLRLDRPQGARARPASACCTAGASCWRPCPRSSAAAT